MASFSKRLRAAGKAGRDISELLDAEDELRQKIRRDQRQLLEALNKLATEFDGFRRGEAP